MPDDEYMKNDEEKPDGPIAWLVMVTFNKFTRPVFVMAVDDGEARIKALQEQKWVSGTVTLDVHVLDGTTLNGILPDVKTIARKYWMLACEHFNEMPGAAEGREASFEGDWEEHGHGVKS